MRFISRNKDKDGEPVKNKEHFSNNEEKPEKEKKAKIIKPFDKRNKSLKMISVSSAILFIAIVIIFNLVFESLLGTQLKWDWSQTDMFSVGDVTTELVGKLDKDIRIVGLYEKGSVSEFKDVEILLDEYVKLSNGKITVQYIDPVKTPSILKQLDPEDLLKPVQGTFVVRCESKNKSKVITTANIYQTEMDENYQQKITGVTAEQAFSGAIVYTTSDKTPVVYMTKGQGEADYATNYTTMVAILQDNNFLVKDIDLLTATVVPADAELLIMLSPVKDINSTAKDIVGTYLKKGKALLVLTEFNNATFPVLNTLLADYNIEISNNRVREGDKERRYQDDAYFFLVDAPTSFVTTEAVTAGTLLQNVRAINELKNAKDWIKLNPILQSSAQALVEENGDPAKTSPASITNVALASENSGFVDGTTVMNSAKVMVIGETDFIADSILKSLGTQVYNMYSFYTSVQWLMNVNDSGLMITAKELPSYLLTGGSNTTFWIATIVCIIILPVGLLIAALVVYRKRKNL